MKVIATACNSKYFVSAKTLVYSILKFGDYLINEIHVYDLGLSKSEVAELHCIKKVRVCEIPSVLMIEYPHFKDPKNFAWKTYIIQNEAAQRNSFFYIDAGACFVRNFDSVFDIIEKDDIFLVDDIYQTNQKWCHLRSLEILGATCDEIVGHQICAGLQGYKKDGRYNCIVNQAFEYAKNEDCIIGDVENHRHDQCIYSVLSLRNNCPRQDIHIFGEWRGIMSANQVVYVHRGQYLIHSHRGYYYKYFCYLKYRQYSMLRCLRVDFFELKWPGCLVLQFKKKIAGLLLKLNPIK
jgi:hypothetical protein